MNARHQWNELSKRNRRFIVLGASLEGLLKIQALRDLTHRSAAEIRGPKWAWSTAVVLANSAGAVPLAYFLLGRRKQR